MKRLPMLWAALAALAIAAAIGIVYTLGHVGVRGPGAADPFVVHVAFADAAGLDPADRPLAAVAGTRQGRVTGVRRDGGRAIATLTLDGDVEGKIFADAAATIRPAGAVPVLSVDIDPGTPGTRPLADGATISEQRSSTYVAPDKVLDVLDADTRAELQILLGESATALRGRSGDLARAAIDAAPLTSSAAHVSRAMALRRVTIRRLVGELATVARTLRQRRETLVAAIEAGRTVMATTARRSDALSATVAELPGMLEDTDRALREVRAVAGPLREGLSASAPALANLPAGLRELRALAPQTQRLVSDLATLESLSTTQLPAIRQFTRRLPQAATAGRPSVTAAAKTIGTLSDYGSGLAQLGDLVSGALSTNDDNGVLARAMFSSIEPIKPENFGLPGQTSRAGRLGSRSRLPAMLAAALDHQCERELSACVLRVSTPGLPPAKEAP